jgi:hypothetical protein
MKHLKGETLVEVTVSLGIMTVALTGALMLITNVTHVITNNKIQSQATAYAEEGSEIATATIKNCGCSTAGNYLVNAGGGSLVVPTGGDLDINNFATIPNTTIKRRIAVEDIPASQVSPASGPNKMLPTGSRVIGGNAADYVLVTVDTQWVTGPDTNTTTVKTIVKKG